MRYWLLTSDLPDPQPQVPVRDGWGRVVGHGDLGWAEPVQRPSVSFSAVSTRATLSRVALAPMRPIRQTVAA